MKNDKKLHRLKIMMIKAFLEKIFFSIQKKASFFKNNYSKNEMKDDVIVVATPSVVNHKKLPIQTLKKLIPIRDFGYGRVV